MGGVVLVVTLGGVVAMIVGHWPAKRPASIPPRPALVAVEPTAAPATDTSRAPSVLPAPAPDASPPSLPASNAFTTLADYRQRKASAAQTPEPMTPAPAGRTPETELGQVTFAVRDFRVAFGSNPVGSNREITRALLGDNARRAKLIPLEMAVLNARGELLDGWGHPYFFHALSGAVMEIRSAGPDGKVFTADDLVR